MTRLIISGCNGKMGRMLTACIANRCDCEIVAGFDINVESTAGYPVFSNPLNCNIEADAIIDFSHPSALNGVLNYAKLNALPVVVATTGLTAEQIADVRAMADNVPVFFSANMSLGISLLAELARKAAALLGGEFDVEIVEKHHNQKIDAPSGTALLLADALSEALPYEAEYVYDRHAVRQKRDTKEIGFSSIRGGTIVGEHDVIFAGRDEVITLSHSAASKEVFAVGAINAALFLVGKAPGYYSMADLVASV
ncbi:MAG: 4-hydroxy-tetrahydrodipicolinate reductase [Clostridia bacterium]|nr:4-hydroxy-tetrahydrodipicolinate reductase [Clostridia bacterium]